MGHTQPGCGTGLVRLGGLHPGRGPSVQGGQSGASYTWPVSAGLCVCMGVSTFSCVLGWLVEGAWRAPAGCSWPPGPALPSLGLIEWRVLEPFPSGNESSLPGVQGHWQETSGLEL